MPTHEPLWALTSSIVLMYGASGIWWAYDQFWQPPSIRLHYRLRTSWSYEILWRFDFIDGFNSDNRTDIVLS